jgi:hypothetical protein
MVEMLMAAFILSIGILGISMLQIMSMKSSRGGQSLSTATHIAEQVMDQIELEGRLTLLNITSSNYSAPPAITGLQFVGVAAPPNRQYNIQGQAPEPSATDPKLRDPFFTVNVVQNAVAAGAQGAAQDAVVTVTWTDTVDAANTAIQRRMTLTRRIVHG